MNDQKVGKQIESTILSILEHGSLQRSTIVEQVKNSIERVNPNTIQGSIARLKEKGSIVQTERGVWALPGVDEPLENEIVVSKSITKNPENLFYESFAGFLITRGECTVACHLGGNKLRDYWATPDVVGIDRVSERALHRRSEITAFVSAEVKTSVNSTDIITAFGQSCAYLLFSHKVFLVLPNNISGKDEKRIESLCRLLGLGLVYFNSNNPDDPNYQQSLPPLPRDPDIFALNKVLANDDIFKKLIEKQAT